VAQREGFSASPVDRRWDIRTEAPLVAIGA